MKTKEEIYAQCERIMSLFLKGCGSQKRIEKVEEIFFRIYNLSGV